MSGVIQDALLKIAEIDRETKRQLEELRTVAVEAYKQRLKERVDGIKARAISDIGKYSEQTNIECRREIEVLNLLLKLIDEP